jgi:hypothetical protein
MIKKGKELKRDMESALLANKAKVAGNTSTARELAGIESWISSNVNSGATAVEATGDGTDARTPGTPRSFDEAQLKDVLAQCYDNGGDPNLLMLGSFNKQAASSFVGDVTRNVDSVEQTLNTAISVYVSDFGTLQITTDRYQNLASGLALDTDFWAVSMYRDFSEFDLAKTGDSDKKQIIVEYTLEARNEKSSGAVYDLTTA